MTPEPLIPSLKLTAAESAVVATGDGIGALTGWWSHHAALMRVTALPLADGQHGRRGRLGDAARRSLACRLRTLPPPSGPATFSRSPFSLPRPHTRAAEILLVEDSPDDVELTLRALRRARIANRIHVARDGEEALTFLFGGGDTPARRADEMPAVILLDVKLPKIDGLEVLRRIKEDPLTKTVPVVMLTSSNEARDVATSYHLGVNSYIVKPVNFEQFAASVTQLGM